MLVSPQPAVTNENETEKEKPKTEYEQMLWKMQHDARWLKEVSLGKRIGWYRLSETIGSGNFSQVKMAVNSLTRDQVAVKIIDKTKLDVKTRKMVAQEIKSMEAAHHPNIIRLLEVIDTYRKLYLVLEYAACGQLYGLVTTEGALSQNKARGYMRQVAQAVLHLHNLGYVHRDIKAENVFLSTNDIVKLGDFGFSAALKDDPHAKLTTFCGSPPYAAPELFCDASYSGPPVDVWAFGVLLFFLLTATFPFCGDTIGQLKAAILKGTFEMPATLPTTCQHIIEKTLTQKPDERLTMSEIITNEWFNAPPSNRNSVRKSSLTMFAKKLRPQRKDDARRKSILRRLELQRVPEMMKSNKTADISSACDGSEGGAGGGGARLGLGRSFDAGALPSTRLLGPGRCVELGRCVMWPSVGERPDELGGVERVARDRLARLGVSSDVLLEGLAGGSRSPLVGAYRCVVTRVLHEEYVWDSLADPRVMRLRRADPAPPAPPAPDPAATCACAPACVLL